MPKDKCMHPTRCKAWERNNPRFPISYSLHEHTSLGSPKGDTLSQSHEKS